MKVGHCQAFKYEKAHRDSVGLFYLSLKKAIGLSHSRLPTGLLEGVFYFRGLIVACLSRECPMWQTLRERIWTAESRF